MNACVMKSFSSEEMSDQHLYSVGSRVESNCIPAGRKATESLCPHLHLYSAWDRIKGDCCPGGGRAKWNRSVPHIGWEENKPSRHRLNRAAHGIVHGRFEGWLSELDPALLGRSIERDIGNRHIIAGTDQALRMDVIGVKALCLEPRRPGAGKGESRSATAGQR